MKRGVTTTCSLLIFVMLIMLLISTVMTGCIPGDPASNITVVNNTDQMFSIYIDEWLESDVPANTSSEFSTIAINPQNIYSDEEKFLFEAKNDQDEVIYSEEFTWQELDDIEWTIVIPRT